MRKAILLDLDGTLLLNPMSRFVPAYLEALATFAAPHVPPDRLIPALLAATRAMDRNDGRGPTNEEVFASSFFPAVGVERAALEPVFARFYAERFPTLRRLTAPVAAARPLVERALRRGLQVVIATNPLFPRTAIEQRLEWAGLPVDELPFALVTTFETMHATKESPAYYAEILTRIGRRPEECLMAGDDWGWDIVPAVEFGIEAYWVCAAGTGVPDAAVPLVGHGALADLAAWLATADPVGSEPE